MDSSDSKHYRWILVLFAIIVMMTISIYQYSWSLIAYAIRNELKWDLATIGLTFTVYAYCATFIQPFSGIIADTYGPKKVAFTAAILIGLGFILSSYINSPIQLYILYGLGSIGVGILYGISTAMAVKWFPDKRGLATGLVVFGFGSGTAIFNWIIQGILANGSFRNVFLYMGLLMLALLTPASLLYKYPPPEYTVKRKINSKNIESQVNYKPTEMLKTYQWYLIYFSFTFTVSIVLMFGAQMKMLAKEFNIPKEYFNMVLILFPLGNGLSRIVSGTVSDAIGRAKTMVIFYLLLGISILCLVNFGQNPLSFTAIVFMASLLGGSPFALYPATIGDYYGPRYATTNYGITYTAKAWAGLISGWLSGYLVMQYGTYRIPLMIVAICSIIAAIISNPKILKKPENKQ